MIPFSPLTSSSLSLSGDVKLTTAGLHFDFQLLDPQGLTNPTPLSTYRQGPGKRLNELWKTTCFEIFWRLPGQNSYWEFNVGASGDWNIYDFTRYRDPQPPHPAPDFELIRLETHALGIRGEIQGPLAKQVEASLCAVLLINQQPQYFSHKHAGPKPDFHHANSFTLIRG